MLSNFHSNVFREKCKSQVWGKLQRRPGSRVQVKQARKMKLQKGEMLSNFEIEGFCGELQRTVKKQSGAGSGGSREGSRRLPEASQGPRGSFLEAAGEAQRRRRRFYTKFCDFFENSGPVLGSKTESKSTKIGEKWGVCLQQAFWNDFLSILEAFWGPFLHDFWKLLDTGCQVKNVQKLLVFVHFRGSGASVRRSKFDVFWKSFWTLLLEAFWEAFWSPKWSQMEAKMGQKSDQKSRRILKTILDGAGRGQDTPEWKK